MQFKSSGTEMDQPLDGKLKAKYTDSWGKKNIIHIFFFIIILFIPNFCLLNELVKYISGP